MDEKIENKGIMYHQIYELLEPFEQLWAKISIIEYHLDHIGERNDRKRVSDNKRYIRKKPINPCKILGKIRHKVDKNGEQNNETRNTVEHFC